MSSPDQKAPDFHNLSNILRVDKEALVKKYTKRINKWNAFFNKWENIDSDEDTIEYMMNEEDDWKLRDSKEKLEDLMGISINEIGDREKGDESEQSECDGDEQEDEESECNELTDNHDTENEQVEDLASRNIEVLEYTQTEDQFDYSLSEDQFMQMKQSVIDIQKCVPVEVEVDHVDDAVCQICSRRTFLPMEFFSLRASILCNQCLVSESGHDDCEVDQCQICPELASQILERVEISNLFRRGQLIWLPGQED